ncbi:hypothetical protein [Methylobacterium tardum]|uniref:Uncharacterized protein n=1 Tax=Methylobacterium tardum TaxID=374432 RepID=A0AA37TKC1_9HYPH|nr:hypothetical protein GCM10007890_33240 [Methylobacterium tardum]
MEGAAAPLAEPVGPSWPCAAVDTLGVSEACGAAAWALALTPPKIFDMIEPNMLIPSSAFLAPTGAIARQREGERRVPAGAGGGLGRCKPGPRRRGAGMTAMAGRVPETGQSAIG